MKKYSALSVRLPSDVKAKVQLQAGTGNRSLNAEIIRILEASLEAAPIHFRLYQRNGFFLIDTGIETEVHSVFQSKREAVSLITNMLICTGLDKAAFLDMTQKESFDA